MNIETDHDDKPLRAALSEWKESSPLPPRFQQQVWQRIEKAEAAKTLSLGTYLSQWFEKVFARPALAVAYVAILLIAGIVTGSFHAHQKQARMDNELGSRYVQSIDPYQKLASR